MTTRTWTHCTRENPCRVCGQPDSRSSRREGHCSFLTEDPDLVRCFKVEAAPAGWTRLQTQQPQQQGGGLYRLTETIKEKKKPTGPDWQAMAMRFAAALKGEPLDELVRTLLLPQRSIEAFGVGWADELRVSERKVYRNVWTFPERNHKGEVVGLNLRDREGNKWNVDGGKRGLMFCAVHLATAKGPVLVVEGATDTIACHACDLPVVGRPGSRSGLRDLIHLLNGRDVIVVGEWDAKDDGKWEGREAAELVAAKLAMAWGDDVRWAMTPDRVKDTRSWITPRIFDEGDPPDRVGQELVERLEKLARKANAQKAGSHPDSRELIANVIDEWQAKKLRPVAVPMPMIVQQLNRLTDGWPRRVGGIPFALNPSANGNLPTSDNVTMLTRPDTLFGWIHGSFDVRWTREEAFDRFTSELRNPPSKSEFFARLAASAEPNYDAIEFLPHHPKLRNTFYLPWDPPESDGSALAELVDHLNPETDLDRDLMIACFLTMAWGGPFGRRPGFVFTSDHGRGAGKTRTAMMLANVWGGVVSIAEHEDWDRVRSRLLADDSLAKRAVLIDNIRGRMARSGLESALTAEEIDGHRMYTGQFSRPNSITWLFTANTPQLSTDLTARSVIIKIGAPQHASDFETWAARFFEERRADLIADALHRLRAGPVCDVEDGSRDRWGPWIDGVLRTFENANELLAYIAAGRPAVDQDLREAEDIAGVIAAICARVNCDPATSRVSIAKADLREWLLAEQLIEPRFSTKALTTKIKDLMGLPPLKPLSEMSGRASGRRWLWSGPSYVGGQTWQYDPQYHGGAPTEPSHQGTQGTPTLPLAAPDAPAAPSGAEGEASYRDLYDAEANRTRAQGGSWVDPGEQFM